MDRIKLARHQSRHEAAVSRQNLVCADHREAIAERQDDARLDASQGRRQLDIFRDLGQTGARGIVEPMHAKQVEWMRTVRRHILERRLDRRRNQRRIPQLRDSRQEHARILEAGHGVLVYRLVHHRTFESQARHVFAPV